MKQNKEKAKGNALVEEAMKVAAGKWDNKATITQVITEQDKAGLGSTRPDKHEGTTRWMFDPGWEMIQNSMTRF